MMVTSLAAASDTPHQRRTLTIANGLEGWPTHAALSRCQHLSTCDREADANQVCRYPPWYPRNRWLQQGYARPASHTISPTISMRTHCTIVLRCAFQRAYRASSRHDART
jgi:hypothetical protein